MGLMIPGSNPSRGTSFFSYAKHSDQVLGPTQPPIQWVQVSLFLGHEPEHSPPSSAEVNEWTCTSTAPVAFMVYRGTALPF